MENALATEQVMKKKWENVLKLNLEISLSNIRKASKR